MHQNTFNADFFFATATVVPILLLALTLQGRTFEDLLIRIYKEYKEEGLPLKQQMRRLIIGLALLTIMAIIIYSGFVGEWVSVLALYHRSASPSDSRGVLTAVFVLLIITIAGPTLRLLGAELRMIMSLRFHDGGTDSEDPSKPLDNNS